MITDVSLYRYRLPFTSPVRFGETSYHEREGCLLRIEHEPDYSGWGEIAPLPYFSRESLLDVIDQITHIKNELQYKPIPTNIVSLTSRFYPSVRFGLETALLMIGAAKKNVTLAQMINPSAVKPIPLQALLSGTKEQMLTRAEDKFRQGFRTFKMKIGRLAFSEELNILAELRTTYGDSIFIRLDANRAYDYASGVTVINELEPFQVEYIEEPFQSFDELTKFTSEHDNRIIALDESLRELPLEFLAQKLPLDTIKAFIIKPTLHGYIQSIQLVRLAFENGIISSFSSAYESGLGIYLVAVIASTVSTIVPVGIDTLDIFGEQLISPPLSFTDGTFDCYANNDIVNRIDLSALTEVTLP